MAKAFNDADEMELIYNVAKDVFDGKYSKEYGVMELSNKVSATDASIKMYFDIYKKMRKGECYKMGTGETFTKFLLVNIYYDFGREAFINALKAVKGNYEYRKSVNNTQSNLIPACEDAIKKVGENINLDDIPAAEIISANEKTEQIRELYTTAVYEMQRERELRKAAEIDYTIQDSNENDIELNIQPAASILNVFSRLSYKPWYAIAEFVDNSTQSYLTHEDELKREKSFDKLVVKVYYDQNYNTLTITDNAYGMEIERFRDAILLDSKNSSQKGRNEFGMGLKTAASWFGNVWTVTSTQYGSDTRYTATIDIPKLKEYSLNTIQIHRQSALPEEHGTVILIQQVTKKITASRTIGKIRDLLSSMYRRDINDRNIEIWFNGEPIVFEEYPVLTNFRGKTWKKELDFTVDFMDKNYHVTGFVAIMNPGSFPKAGFALFRQDRVVVGGTDTNYKPDQIFGQAQSQRSLKLFGELNMNDFPVNQAKDGFIWDDGLEDAFIDALKDNIQEYIDIANLSIKERAEESQYTPEKSEELQQKVADTLEKVFAPVQSRIVDIVEDENKEEESDDNSDLQQYIDTVLNVEAEEKTVSSPRHYTIPMNAVQNVEFNVQWTVGTRNFWIDYIETETDKYDVYINIDHPFFMPFSKDDDFKKVLEKFTIAFVLSERQAQLSSDRDGYIHKNVIKNYMNKYLMNLAGEND